MSPTLMPGSGLRVYLSSTVQDLAAYRQAATEDLVSLGLTVFGTDRLEVSETHPLDQILSRVAEADIYVGIVAWRYGWIPPGESTSIVELEYRAARRYGKPTLMLLLDGNAPWPRDFKDLDDGRRVEDFRRAVASESGVGYFTSLEDFRTLLVRSVSTILTRRLQAPKGLHDLFKTAAIDHLPLAWHLVVAGHAKPDLLLHLDPARFAEAFEAMERAEGTSPDTPLATRLFDAARVLETRSYEGPSRLWMSWMRATRRTATEQPS